MFSYSPNSTKNISAIQDISNISQYPNMPSCAPFGTNRPQNRPLQKQTPHKRLVRKGFCSIVEVPSGFEPLYELLQSSA